RIPPFSPVAPLGKTKTRLPIGLKESLICFVDKLPVVADCAAPIEKEDGRCLCNICHILDNTLMLCCLLDRSAALGSFAQTKTFGSHTFLRIRPKQKNASCGAFYLLSNHGALDALCFEQLLRWLDGCRSTTVE